VPDTETRPPDTIPERLATAIDTARAARAAVDESRTTWYAAVADAVEVARAEGITTAQAVVARALGISRQRVSELARRT
jgi:hypothetical protein